MVGTYSRKITKRLQHYHGAWDSRLHVNQSCTLESLLLNISAFLQFNLFGSNLDFGILKDNLS